MTNFESISTLHCIHAKEQKAELRLDTIHNSIFHLALTYLKHFIEYALILRSVVTPQGAKPWQKWNSTGLKLAPKTRNEYCMLHLFLPKIKVSS